MTARDTAGFTFAIGKYYKRKTDNNGVSRVVKITALFKALSARRVAVVRARVSSLDETGLFTVTSNMEDNEQYNILQIGALYSLEVLPEGLTEEEAITKLADMGAWAYK